MTILQHRDVGLVYSYSDNITEICYSLYDRNYFLFHVTTFHSVLVLFVPQLPKYGTPYRLTLCSLKRCLHLDVIRRPTNFSQPILPLRPDSLLRLWRYIYITYLLTLQ